MKDIKEYEGLYAITSCGKVWSYRTNKFLKPRINKRGYSQVVLVDSDGKHRTHTVHRLVLKTYRPVKNMDKLEVNHIKEFEKSNNCLNNLEWVTHKENMDYGTRNKRAIENHRGKEHLTKQKPIYCIELDKTFTGSIVASKELGIKSRSNITDCCKGRNKTAGKHPITGERLHWRYADTE